MARSLLAAVAILLTLATPAVSADGRPWRRFAIQANGVALGSYWQHGTWKPAGLFDPAVLVESGARSDWWRHFLDTAEAGPRRARGCLVVAGEAKTPWRHVRGALDAATAAGVRLLTLDVAGSHPIDLAQHVPDLGEQEPESALPIFLTDPREAVFSVDEAALVWVDRSGPIHRERSRVASLRLRRRARGQEGPYTELVLDEKYQFLLPPATAEDTIVKRHEEQAIWMKLEATLDLGIASRRAAGRRGLWARLVLEEKLGDEVPIAHVARAWHLLRDAGFRVITLAGTVSR